MTGKIDRKYKNILSRINKKFSIEEGFYIIIKLYLTNNVFYYILCILFRFVSLIIISGDYLNTIKDNNILSNNSISIQQFLKKVTLHYLLTKFSFSFRIYMIICLFIYILFIIRLINYYYIIKKIKCKKLTTKWPSPTKFQIINDHILFLLFPYILEFLSFSYYIYLFPNVFIIKLENKLELFLIMILNTVLIIFYNINNYLFIICSNKKYTTDEVEVFIKIKENKLLKNYKSIFYKYSDIFLYSFVILQNVVLVQTLENYLSIKYKNYYRLLLSIIIFIILIFLVIKLIYEYNYNNLVNNIINILLLFCFYSIIIDAIIFFSHNKKYNLLYQIIYNLLKILLSYVTNSLIHFKFHISLENKIKEILFQEKEKNNEGEFIDAFIYLSEIMFKIKEKNDYESNVLLLNFFNQHINGCNKINCNCKLLNMFIKNNNNNKNNSGVHISSNLLIVLNFLYEASFLEYDYYNKYDMTILLSEHFCHLRDNPIMAFSLINSLIINHKFSKFQMVELYELCQKYIYFIMAKEKYDKDYKIKENNRNLNSPILNKEYYKKYFNSIIISIKIKKIINNYLENLFKILKYKNIFKDSLTFQYDENNEYINSCRFILRRKSLYIYIYIFKFIIILN